jgi:hypothetical protein
VVLRARPPSLAGLCLFPMRALLSTEAVASGSVAHPSAIAHAEPESPATGHATADDKEDPSGFQCGWGRRQAEEGHLLGTPLNCRAMSDQPERLMPAVDARLAFRRH